ncbi:MAG: Rab family GTPase [Candidatus Hodarchaeales archaeon]
MSTKFDFLAKILILGEFRVGKSSMVLRYVEDRFPGDYMATIGANFLVKTVKLNVDEKDVCVGLQIWDLGGHTRSTEVGKVFFQGVSGALLVYDITRPDTLEKIELWQEQLAKHSSDVILYLVGNKNDLENYRAVTIEDGKTIQKTNKIDFFFETSAKTGDHIQETFEHMAISLVKAN